jgi:transposase
VQIVLNEAEMERAYVLRQVKDRKLTQAEAGYSLGLSDRQIRRLLKRIENQGLKGVKSCKVGGNRAFREDFKHQVIKVVQTKYVDFGPTFASEKLRDSEGLSINKETLRCWMIEAGLWKGRLRKAARIHQSRERRSCFGELVQIDGSHHDWFEGRGDKCCLLVFIDDATSKIVSARFEGCETTLGYMRCVSGHVQVYGRPLSYYSDKHGIFRQNKKDCVDGRLTDTQFHRALRSLGIELICANSSQAKGRVERANKTLQDRLIKEMRLRTLSSIEEGNAYIPEFIEQYNKRFAVEAADSQDAHRTLYHTPEKLRQILSVQTNRKVSKNLELSHNCILYQLVSSGLGYHLRHTTVTVCERIDGEVDIVYKEKSLPYKKKINEVKSPLIVDTKELNSLVDRMVMKQSSQTQGLLRRLPTGPTAPCPA